MGERIFSSIALAKFGVIHKEIHVEVGSFKQRQGGFSTESPIMFRAPYCVLQPGVPLECVKHSKKNGH